MKILRHQRNFLLLLPLLLLCLPACRDLAPGGVYQGDKVLYEAEQAITEGHALLQEFVTWEKTHRDALAQFPEIRKFADKVYNEGPSWFGSAAALKDAYKSNPTQENKDKLQLAVGVLRTAIQQASVFLTQPATNSPPPNN